jgi:hypothetical protein
MKYFFAGLVMACILVILPINLESNLLNMLAGLFVGAFVYGISLVLMKTEIIYIFVNKMKSLKLFIVNKNV